jgi:hypothetical protein
LERGLKPLPNELLAIIIKINLTTNYQLLLNCNKVHRACMALLCMVVYMCCRVGHNIVSIFLNKRRNTP